MPHAKGVELWGGVEFTCNRVRDTYFDQMELSGHARRTSDYEAIAELGIRTLRTGILWERFERGGSSWAWSDQHLHAQRKLGIRPIASLLHHGSGPEHTNLLDPHFAEKLSGYAAEVAERYPWIDAYTPVNEPNATARFSAMYGLWYPHHRSRGSFVRALLHQTKAIVMSMQAVRRVRPDAKLIQTDDGGRITGTPELRSTWELLNQRQWLCVDLLCGLVDRQHPLFPYLRREGISEREIFWYRDNPCPPDVIGVNYYVTSDRYLDHRLDLYPAHHRSAEGPFVDVETVRVRSHSIAGVTSILTEVWEKYKLPLAITEVHLGCAAEEQIRWMAEIWAGVQEARRRGADCIAMTAWALLGSHYWNELVTRANGHFEPGAFSLTNGSAEPNELGRFMQQIATGRAPEHPSLAQKGWWHVPERFLFPLASDAAASGFPLPDMAEHCWEATLPPSAPMAL